MVSFSIVGLCKAIVRYCEVATGNVKQRYCSVMCFIVGVVKVML